MPNKARRVPTRADIAAAPDLLDKLAAANTGAQDQKPNPGACPAHGGRVPALTTPVA